MTDVSTTETNIVHHEANIDWMRSQPVEILLVLTSRSALRMLPNLSLISPKQESEFSIDELEKVIIPTLRAASLAWTLNKYPTYSDREITANNAAEAATLAATQINDNHNAITSAALSASTIHVYSKLKNNRDKNDVSLLMPFIVRGAINTTTMERLTYADGAGFDSDCEWVKNAQNKNITNPTLAQELIGKKLWLNTEGKAINSLWPLFKMALPKSGYWSVWTRWYEARIAGAEPNRNLELFRVLQREEFWQQNSTIINKTIWDKEQEILGLEARSQLPEKLMPPEIPPQQPAAIEPVWQGDVLTLPKAVAKSDLGRSSGASLRALKEQLAELVEDTKTEQNCVDQRFAEFLHRVAERMPTKSPPQHALIRLGHDLKTLTNYSKTVSEEWPESLAARYHGMTLAFEETLRQFPKWKEFLATTRDTHLSPEQIADAPKIAQAVIDLVSNDGPSGGFVDPALLGELNALKDELANALEANSSPAITNPEIRSKGLKERALDLIESSNNILKSVARKATSMAKATGRVGMNGAKVAASDFASVLKEYYKGFVGGAKKSAKVAGATAGAGAVGWALKSLAEVLWLASGASSSLFAKFPQVMAWLESFLSFVK